MKPRAKALLITTIIYSVLIIAIIAIVFVVETPSHVSTFKRHLLNGNFFLSIASPIIFWFCITWALIEFSFKRKIKKQRDEQDRLEQKETQAKMNKVLDMQLAELERKQKELEEREQKIKEHERYMPK